MRFFKHFTDSHRGKSLRGVRRELGIAGVGQYWTLVEMCAEKLEKESDEEYTAAHCVFEFERGHMAQELGTKQVRLDNVLGTFQKHSLIALESSDNVIKISMPKLLECMDRDAKRARQERGPAAPKRKSKRKKEISITDDVVAETSIFLLTWNSETKELPKAETWDQERAKAAIKLKKSVDEWREICRRVEASDFLSGRNGKWEGCNIDWALNPKNAKKVLAGNYDSRAGKSLTGGWDE